MLTTLPSKARAILAKYKDVGYNDRLVAEWAADELLEHFRPLDYGSKPEQLTSYERMPLKERQRWDELHPDWRKGGIEEWERQKRTALLENSSNIYWLSLWADVLVDDTVRHAKIVAKLREFDSAPVLKQPKKDISPEAYSVAEKFGGEVTEWEE